jgi:hypothetical protein
MNKKIEDIRRRSILKLIDTVQVQLKIPEVPEHDEDDEDSDDENKLKPQKKKIDFRHSE